MRPKAQFCHLRNSVVFSLFSLILLGRAVDANAQTLVAPLGGEPVPVGAHRVICASANELGGWHMEAGGARIRPPDAQAVPGTTRVKTAAQRSHCGASEDSLALVSVAAWPTIFADSLVVNVDAGRIDVRGKHLKNVGLTWRVGEISGHDICRDPQAGPDGESCAFVAQRNLSADAALWSLTLLPSGIPSEGDVSAYDSRGRALNLSRYQRHPAKLVLIDLVPSETSVDVAAEVARITLRHPEAVAQVTCRVGSCELDKQELVVRNAGQSEDTFEAKLSLRPHVFFQGATQLLAAPTISVPLQRCPLNLASSPPLRNVAGQKLVVAVGGRCQDVSQLKFFIGATQARVVQTLQQGDRTFVVLATDVVLGDELALAVQHRNTTTGLIRARTRQLPNAKPRIELENYGAIDFIPSNRDADVVLPSLGAGQGTLVPVGEPGVYNVIPGMEGSPPRVRGVHGATGWVPLRLAYRDLSLPGALREINLAEFSDSVDRNIHSASIPISIGSSANSNTPLVELLCDRADTTDRLIPGKAISIAYQEKDACRLVLHRERLRPEDGDQLLRLTVNVAALDGTNRPEAGVDQRLLLRPSSEPRIVWLTGVAAPFDRMVVRVAVVTQDLHNAVQPLDEAERLSLPQVQWAVTVGNSRLRLYTTTALPTGLFRVADRNHSGLMGLNAGILARLVALTTTGVQAPVGLEFGTMVLGITGDSTPSRNGHVGVVGGLSLSVPIANVSRITQASISLHIWGEYEVSRALMKDAGTPWGFVFGPSLSFGDVGVNL